MERKDLQLYNAVRDYFSAASDALWERKETGYITRTVGILALFDVMKLALRERRIELEEMKKGAQKLLSKASAIDFSDNFFQASGVGRVRIRKVLEFVTGLRSADEIGVDAAREARRLSKT